LSIGAWIGFMGLMSPLYIRVTNCHCQKSLTSGKYTSFYQVIPL